MRMVEHNLAFLSRGFLTIAMSALLLTGCGNHGAGRRMSPDDPQALEETPALRATATWGNQTAPSSPAAANIKTEIMQDKRKPDSTLAYTHEIQIEVSRDRLATQLDTIKNACINDKDASCTILNINSSNDEYVPSGYISMRLAPNKVDGMVNLAGQHGKIISQSTSAEDLAPQLTDTTQRLATLSSYRDKLNGFMTKRDMPAVELVTIARELSDTQTQIEAMSRTHAELKHRVDTDLLNIRFSVPAEEYSRRQTPIKDSIRSFGEHFRYAISGVIDFFAYVLPWIPVMLLILFGIRKLWRFFKKKPLTQPST